jgi:acyltransferase
MTPRNDTIDNARAIGIVLVVLGHTMGLPASASLLIFAVHMPLFFMLSGWMLKDTAWTQPLDHHLRRQVRALMLPFVVFFALSYAYWLLTADLGARAAKYADVAWYEPLGGLLLGRYAELEFVNGPLWFFGALLIASVGYAGACRALGWHMASVLTMALATAAMVSASRVGDGLPFSADIAVVGAGFMALGHVIGRRFEPDRLPRLWAWVGTVVLAPVFVWRALHGGTIDLAAWRFGDTPLHSLVTALLGIALLLSLARIIPPSRVGRWLSQHTLIIFPTHIVLLNLTSGVAQLGFGMSQADVRTPTFAVLSAAVALLAAVPTAWLLQRALPGIFKAPRVERPARASGSIPRTPAAAAAPRG